MSRLTDLLRQVEKKDQRLADDLRREFAQLSKRRAFELNFERHVPESVELPGRPMRKGDKVRFLPERGQSAAGLDRRLWQVTGSGKAATKHADLLLDPLMAIRHYDWLGGLDSPYPKVQIWLAVS